MSTGLSAIVLFSAFIIMMLLNVPIAICLGGSALITMILLDIPLSIVPMMVSASISKFTLLAVPFFILSGNIMESSGISQHLIKFANALIGHRKGGLAIVCIVVSCFFAAISGSGPATVAALGTIMIPAMINAGYGKGNSTALCCSGGSIGIIIPPSIVFVVYCGIVGTSIGEIFIAGILPGILMGVCLIITNFIVMKYRKLDVELQPKSSKKQILQTTKTAIWALLMPIIVLGGIYTGLFTPTEAAGVSAAYGLFVGVVIYKNLNVKQIKEIFVRSCVQTGGIMLICGTAGLFAWLCQSEGISQMAARALQSIGSTQTRFLLLINIIFFIAGMFVDSVSALYIFMPVVLPVASHYGYDLTALGVVLIMNLAIGLITPPVGNNLFVGCNIAGITLKDLSRHIYPYVLALMVATLIVSFVPQITLFLPKILGM